MKDNPKEYFKKAKVVNFDVINHQCRGDKLQRTEKDNKTIDKRDLKDHPEKESKEVSSAVFRNLEKSRCWLCATCVTVGVG